MTSRIIRACFSFCLVGSLIFLSFGLQHQAHASTGSELQQKINDLTKQKQSKKQEINQTNDKLKTNQNNQQTVKQKLSSIVSQIADTSSKITTTQHTISNTNAQIDSLNQQITVVKVRIKRRDQLLKERVKSMYLSGGSTDYLQILLSSKNFGDLVTRIYALSMIANQDQHILDQQKQDESQLDSQQKEVQSKLESLKADEAQLETLNASLASKKKEQQTLLTQLQKQQKVLETEKLSQQEIADNLASQQAAAQKAYDLWKKDEAAKKAAAAAARTSRSSSPSASTSASNTAARSTSSNSHALFVWPVIGGYVTSPYGPRAFDNEFHPGIDIGKGEGTPIHAAADGVVFRSYLSSSYGNCVMITHYINGQMYTTVYAHMESRLVSNDQVVKQGQVIGYMGQTGDATGPHLHFEVYRGPWTPPPHPGTIDPMSVLP